MFKKNKNNGGDKSPLILSIIKKRKTKMLVYNDSDFVKADFGDIDTVGKLIAVLKNENENAPIFIAADEAGNKIYKIHFVEMNEEGLIIFPIEY